MSDYDSTEKDLDDTFDFEFIDKKTGENIKCNLKLNGWKIYNIISKDATLENKYGKFEIIKKDLSLDKSKPVLVAMAGFSTKSFCGSATRIIENLDKIEEKFSAIYILKYDDIKFGLLQKDACGERDKLKAAKNKDIFSDEEIKEIYKPETDLNDMLGTIVDKILRAINLTKVHILGKCAGGGVAIHTFTKSEIYDALYLGVPASPTDVKHLLDKNISDKLFIFGWDSRDAYPFNWGKKSNQEIERYRETMKNLESNNNVIIREFETGTEHESKYHEIPNGLFDLIAENN